MRSERDRRVKHTRCWWKNQLWKKWQFLVYKSELVFIVRRMCPSFDSFSFLSVWFHVSMVDFIFVPSFSFSLFSLFPSHHSTTQSFPLPLSRSSFKVISFPIHLVLCCFNVSFALFIVPSVDFSSIALFQWQNESQYSIESKYYWCNHWKLHWTSKWNNKWDNEKKIYRVRRMAMFYWASSVKEPL